MLSMGTRRPSPSLPVGMRSGARMLQAPRSPCLTWDSTAFVRSPSLAAWGTGVAVLPRGRYFFGMDVPPSQRGLEKRRVASPSDQPRAVRDPLDHDRFLLVTLFDLNGRVGYFLLV